MSPDLGFPAEWSAPEPALAAPAWSARIIREVRKETVTLVLTDAPEVTFTRHPDAQPAVQVEAAPSQADVVLTTVDGVHWSVQGVTVSAADQAGGLGRYYRHKAADGTWSADVPAWVRRLANDVVVGRTDGPDVVCAHCGYEVHLSVAKGPWLHVPQAPVDHEVSAVSQVGGQ